MFERLNSPHELFHYKLGAALKMENKVLEMLGNLEEAAQSDLITEAEAMGQQDIVQLLQQNLEQEQHTLEEVQRATQQLAERQFASAA